MDGDSREGPNAETFSALVTGANSGLGYAICCRLVDEFLHTRPQSYSLTLILTTRSARKSSDTVSRLQTHLQTACRSAEKKVPGVSKLLERRVRFQAEQLDLTSIASIQQLARKLLGDGGRIDALILNAGIGGWIGVNWGNAVYTVLTDWVHATTWPTMKKSGIGWLCKPQLASPGSPAGPAAMRPAPGLSAAAQEEAPLGEVFCANVFGHYLLAHYLVAALSAPSCQDGTPSCASPSRGRIIWLGSLEAYAHSLSLNDFQAFTTPLAYESSKRITDVLALTSDLAATAPWVAQFLAARPAGEKVRIRAGDSAGQTRPQTSASPAGGDGNLSADSDHPDADAASRVRPDPPPTPPKMYVAHPGICATSIMPLPYVLACCMAAAFWIARTLFGSMWHTYTVRAGARAPVWLALASQEELDGTEEDGKGKWGSATDRWGHDRVERTEVEGWGWSGRVGEVVKKGRWRHATDLTEEDRQEFEVLGAQVWKKMEDLRVEWEGRVGGL